MRQRWVEDSQTMLQLFWLECHFTRAEHWSTRQGVCDVVVLAWCQAIRTGRKVTPIKRSARASTKAPQQLKLIQIRQANRTEKESDRQSRQNRDKNRITKSVAYLTSYYDTRKKEKRQENKTEVGACKMANNLKTLDKIRSKDQEHKKRIKYTKRMSRIGRDSPNGSTNRINHSTSSYTQTYREEASSLISKTSKPRKNLSLIHI